MGHECSEALDEEGDGTSEDESPATDKSALIAAPAGPHAPSSRAARCALAAMLAACALISAGVLVVPAMYGREMTAVVIGAGVAGLAAAGALERDGWTVIVVDARDRIGGRVHSERRRSADGRPWNFEHGASWLHGAGTNPIWRLVQGHRLLSTQWLPRTFHIRSALSPGALELAPSASAPNEPVGEALRDRYLGFLQRRARFIDLLDAAIDGGEESEGGANGSERARAGPGDGREGGGARPPVDVPLSSLLDEFADEARLSPAEREQLRIFYAQVCAQRRARAHPRSHLAAAPPRPTPTLPTPPVRPARAAGRSQYAALDEGEELAQVGLGALVWRSWGDDRELMAGAEGMGAIPAFLARQLRGGEAAIALRARIERVDHGARGVRVVAADGREWRASACVVTVPLGVLQEGRLRFVPRLPAWKRRAIGAHKMGSLEKVALAFNASWWPTGADAFWRPSKGAAAASSEAATWANDSPWYNLANLRAGRSPSDGAHPAVLLATPVGAFARHLARLSDAQAIELLLADLRALFPRTRVPPPVDFARTRWAADPFSRGSYSFPPVGAALLAPSLLAEPVSDVLFWAGEATSAMRRGFVDGAYASGLDAARALQARTWTDWRGRRRPPRFRPDRGGVQPANDIAIRQFWQYQLDQHLYTYDEEGPNGAASTERSAEAN